MNRAAILVLATLLVALVVPAAVAGAAPSVTTFAGRNVETRATNTPTSLTARAPRPSTAPALGLGAPMAEFQVTYNNFSDPARTAFQAAVDVWETLVVSDCVIHVSATWTTLPTGVLGSAGPASFFLGDDDYIYPAALYEAATSNCSHSPLEINASFNSQFANWYMGTDGNTPTTKWDFFSVVMHEIGHGMGVMSSFSVSGGRGYWGFTNNGIDIFPSRYDSYEWTANTGGSKMTSFSPFGTKKLKNQLTDGSVFFGGPEVVAALGSRLKLFAPSPWSGGSSNSHLDEATFGPGTPESLMTPSISNGEAIQSLGPVTLALLRDIGWETSDTSPPTAPENDNFADFAVVTQTANVAATTDEATLEVDEPVPSCSPSAGKSVWYSFTPAASRKFSATTAGSDFDTFIAVYAGTDLVSLAQLKCNDNATGVQTSKFGVQLQAGTTYYFQVGGTSDSGGSLVLRVKKA